MITKKQVLEWWTERGKLFDFRKPDTDKMNLIKEWTGSWTEQQVDKNNIKVILNTPRWKYPIKLFFTNEGECFRIVGF